MMRDVLQNQAWQGIGTIIAILIFVFGDGISVKIGVCAVALVAILYAYWPSIANHVDVLGRFQDGFLPSIKKFSRVQVILTVTSVGLAIIIGLFLVRYSITSEPTWKYISGRGMVLSALEIHNSDLYIGVARDDPRNHGLYRTSIQKCSTGLSTHGSCK